MSVPILSPVSTTSTVVLPSTGSIVQVNDGCPFKIYSNPSSELYSGDFLTGAIDQVTFVYHRLGGDVLDIELTPYNVYAAYEEAVLTYSEILNFHQAKNAMSSLLGLTTGSFDSKGVLSGSLAGSHYEMKYPRVKFSYADRVGDAVADLMGIGGTIPVYSASVDLIAGVQDYDLQAAVSASSTTSSSGFYGLIQNKRIKIRKVFYQTPSSVWRFFGIFGGGAGVYGDGGSYGAGYGGTSQYADNTTFEVVPVWEHKLRAMAFEDAIKVRCSHHSYEIYNNKLRLFPTPQSVGSWSPTKLWFQFSVDDYDESFRNWNSGSLDTDIDGVNNVNSIPFENLPYDKINSLGKSWIRRYALALCKEILGQIRTKFSPLPIPGNNITLNGEQLFSQAKEEIAALKEELGKNLEALEYSNVIKREAEVAEAANKTLNYTPYLIYIG